MNLTIKPIKEIYQLSRAINYLSDSFNWSKEKTKRIENKLILKNKFFGTYGYLMLNDSYKIVGSLLIFFQEFDKKYGQEKMMLNMSSWHINTEARGIYSLLMIKRMLDDFPEYSITNVSSNKKAYKILKALGFKDSNYINRKYNFLNFFSMNRFFYKRNFEHVFNSGLSEITESPFENFKDNYLCRLFKFGNSELKVLTSKATFERKIGFINIRIRGTRIIWVSDPKIFSIFFYRILLFYFIRNFSFFITTHCELYPTNMKPIGESNQIYFSKKIILDNHNIALGSELSFI